MGLAAKRAPRQHCLLSLSGGQLYLSGGSGFGIARGARISARQATYTLPYRSIEFAGRPAIVTTFESVTDATRFEVISDDETYAVLKMYGGGK